ncbi:MAG: YCF48-related protein, partial [Ignavibacteriota bacterium]
NLGVTWDSIWSGTSVNLNAVHFGNIARGYVVGDHGTILMTTDGGYTWVQQHCPTTQNLRSIHMSDPFHGIICGDSGVILTTQNGGYWDNGVDPMPAASSSIRSYPNPFKNKTVVEVPVARSGHVRATIFNLLGEQVAILADAYYEPGIQTLEWKPTDLPSGVYTLRVELDGRVLTSQITLEK